MEISDRIKLARERAGHSRQSLADLFGINYEAVRQWEAGITLPKGSRLKDISDALCVRYEWLTVGVGPMMEGDPPGPLTLDAATREALAMTHEERMIWLQALASAEAQASRE